MYGDLFVYKEGVHKPSSPAVSILPDDLVGEHESERSLEQSNDFEGELLQKELL